MPQIPCKAKTRNNSGLPRSPRIRSLASLAAAAEQQMAVDRGSSKTLVANNSNSNSSSQLLLGGGGRQGTDSLFSILSAPSKISRATTQHYILTPIVDVEANCTTKERSVNEGKNRRLRRPSRRGICILVTIFAIVAVICFLFAGYPLSLYIIKKSNEGSL